MLWSMVGSIGDILTVDLDVMIWMKIIGSELLKFVDTI